MLVKKPLIINATNTRKRNFLIATVLVAVIVGSLLTLELTNTTHIFHKQAVQAPSANQNTKGEPVEPTSTTSADKGSTPSTTTENPAANPDNPKDMTGGGSPTTLIAPSGNFVSAHKVPSNAAIASVCNTTSGASCKITFTSNGVTKSLTAETTDKGGSAYWNGWTPTSIGLTPGSWTIEAVATLGSQTQSAKDALTLEVSQ